MTIPRSKEDRVQDAFLEHPSLPDQTSYVVYDPETTTYLPQILAALGGSSDTTVTQERVSSPTKDTQVTISLPANTKYFELQSMQDALMRVSFSPTGIASNEYRTVGFGNCFKVAQTFTNATDIYVETSVDSDTIEVLSYQNA